MRIVLAAVSYSAEISGVQRHAFNVARCLLTRSEISDVQLVVAPWQRPLVQRSGLMADRRLNVLVADLRRGALDRNAWYYRQLPRIAERLRADIVHLTYPVPIDSHAYRCPTVVSLHDLYPYDIPSNFGFPKVMFNRLVLRQCLRSVDSIACVSNATLRSLLHYFPDIGKQKASRIYNCVEQEPKFDQQLATQEAQEHPLLLCVAQHRRNKNIVFLLQVFHRLLRSGQMAGDTRLFIVGIPGPETGRIRQFIADARLSRNVRLIAGLSDNDLQLCYRKCEALLAPSVIEGFGLPVVEALLAGCRVVCSDIAAFREVGGDRCHYVSLQGGAEAAFAEAVLSSLGRPRRPPMCLPMYSAAAISRQYVSLYAALHTTAGARRGLNYSAACPGPVYGSVHPTVQRSSIERQPQ